MNTIEIVRLAQGGSTLCFKAIITATAEQIEIFKRWSLADILMVSQIEYVVAS